LQSDTKEQETIRHYLLGQATQEDSSSLEERLLRDSALFQALLIAEDELIDQYLSEKLTPAERQRFETHFLIAPERQRKLHFGRALHKYVNYAATSEPLEQYSAENVSDEKPDIAKPPPKRGLFSFLPFSNPIVSYSLAAAMLLIVGGVSWVVFNNWRRQAPQQPGNVYVVTLTPGQTRDLGSDHTRIEVPGNAGVVQLQLEVPTDRYQSYRATLLRLDDGESVTINDLKFSDLESRRIVPLRLPARLLIRGDYVLKLSGLSSAGQNEDLASYSFRVIK
jgi:hypothetical protein